MLFIILACCLRGGGSLKASCWGSPCCYGRGRVALRRRYEGARELQGRRLIPVLERKGNPLRSLNEALGRRSLVAAGGEEGKATPALEGRADFFERHLLGE